MIIGNVNSYFKNPYINNGNYKQLQKVLSSNNRIATINKKDATQGPEALMKQKIRNMKTQLGDSENSEQQLKNGMSVLQEKQEGLDNINDVGNQLKELSTQYKKSDLSEKDKLEIEKKAGELLNNLDNLMNQNKTEENNIVGDKVIQLKASDGKTSTILSKGIDITLDFDKEDSTKPSNTDKTDPNKHFSSNVSIKTLLENPSIIEKRILNPVQKVIEDVHDSKSIIYHNFIEEYSLATSSIDELFKIKGISAREKDSKMLQQKAMYIAVSALYF